MIPKPAQVAILNSVRLLRPIVLQPVLQTVRRLHLLKPTQRPALLLPLILLISTFLLPAHAAAPVLKPMKGKGERCVEDTEFMRKNHMELLLHQRDETVHRGIRTKKHNLKECISCHAINDANGTPVSAADPKHFCRQCHDYTSVKIDCFECHSSKPRPSSRSVRSSSTPNTSD